METAIHMLSRYATPEVLTVFGTLAVAALGYKVSHVLLSKSIGIVGSIAQKVGIAGVIATLFAVAGLGGAGVGFGDLVARWSATPRVHSVGVENAALATMIEKCPNPEMVRTVLEYARNRDGDRDDGTRILGDIITKTQAGEKADPKVLTAYMEYLKAREENRRYSFNGDPKDALVYNGTAPIGLKTTPAVSHESAKQPAEERSPLTIPIDFGMLLGGLATTACGIAVWKSKK